MSILNSNDLRGAHKHICDWLNNHTVAASQINIVDVTAVNDGYDIVNYDYRIRRLRFYADDKLTFPKGFSSSLLSRIQSIEILPYNRDSRSWEDYTSFDPTHLKELPELTSLSQIICHYDIAKCDAPKIIHDLCSQIKRKVSPSKSDILELYLQCSSKEGIGLDLSQYIESTYHLIRSIELPKYHVSKLTVHSFYLTHHKIRAGFASDHIKELYVVGKYDGPRTKKEPTRISISCMNLDRLEIPKGFKIDILNSEVKNLSDFIGKDMNYVDKRSKVKSNLTPVKYNGEPLDMFCNPLHIGDWVVTIRGDINPSLLRVTQITNIDKESVYVFDRDRFIFQQSGGEVIPIKYQLPTDYIEDQHCMKIEPELMASQDQSGYYRDLINEITKIIDEYNQEQ